MKQFVMVVPVGSSTCGCSRLFILFYILYFLYSPIDLYASLEIKKKIRNLCPRECSIRQYSTMCLPCDFFVYYCHIVITHQ
jgi:hypothetical protein